MRVPEEFVKKGDRIKVYGFAKRVQGCESYDYFNPYLTDRTYEVTGIEDFNIICFEHKGEEYQIHHRQCEKIKSPRSLWITERSECCQVILSKRNLKCECGKQCLSDEPFDGGIEFREVMKDD